MTDKFINNRTILLLAAIFLLNMSSYAPTQGDKGGKDKGPAELYEVTMSINGGGPGIETLGCESVGHFYAESMKLGKNLILNIESKGSETPGPEGELAPLNMRVSLPGEMDPITLENCQFYHGGQNECHGEFGGYLPGKIFIRIPKTYDGPGENGDIHIRWWLDSEKLSKKIWRGWLIYSLPYEESPLVYTTNPNPPDFKAVGDSWETDVIGPFVLQHDGLACDAPEDMWSREVLEGFDVHLEIVRVQ